MSNKERQAGSVLAFLRHHHKLKLNNKLNASYCESE